MSHPDGRQPERTLAEIERAETRIENVIVESENRGVSTVEMAGLLLDYAEDLRVMGRAPPGWGESDD